MRAITDYYCLLYSYSEDNKGTSNVLLALVIIPVVLVISLMIMVIWWIRSRHGKHCNQYVLLIRFNFYHLFMQKNIDLTICDESYLNSAVNKL